MSPRHQFLAHQDAFIASGERLRVMVEDMVELVSRIAPDGRLLYANPSFCQCIGRPCEDVIGTRWQPVVPEEDLPHVLEGLAALSPENPVVVIENRVLDSTGQARWMQFSNRGIFGPDGELQEILSVGRDITEQRRLTNALHESQSVYRALFTDSHAAKLLIDPQAGLVIEANHAACALYGYTREAMSGLSLTSLSALEPDRADGLLAKVVSGGAGHYESRHRLASGQVRDMEVRCTTLLRDGMKVVYAIVQDVTERKAMEADLRAMALQRRQAMEAAGMGWWRHDLKTWTFQCDEGTRGLFGLDACEQPSRMLHALIHPDDLPHVLNRERAALDPFDPRPFQVRYRILRDGSVRWMESRGAAAFEGEGLTRRAVDFFGVVADVTEQQRMRQEIRQAKENAERHALAQEHLATAARELSGARSLEEVMAVSLAAARKLTGAKGAAFILREGDLCHYAAEDCDTPLWKGRKFLMASCLSGWAMLNRSTAVVEDPMNDPRVPREAYRPTFVKSVLVAPVRRGDPLAAIGTYWADRRVPEPDEVRLLESLADLASVAMENARLYEELTRRARELEAEKERAEKATLAKSQSLATMSHEIRTPLGGVMGLLELVLMEGGLPERAREFLLLAKQSGRNLLAIIGDILDLSKIEAGKLELEDEPFSLKEMLDSVLLPLEMIARKKGLAFTLVMDPRVPDALRGDKGRLGQVITNVAGNAVKFTVRGRVEVCVYLDPGAGGAPPGTVPLHFRVEDTGPGIPAEKLETVFESFTQAHADQEARNGGTGLGLAITRSLVERMGGSISVESQPGRGSVFTFGAALARCEESWPEPRASTDGTCPDGEEPLDVLLVEDNRINRLFVSEILRQKGHRVDTAASGREAIEKLGGAHFDIVLMDVQMPDMNGIEAVRAIRAGEAGEEKAMVTVVAVTAYALKGDREKFLEAGMDGYLSKPLDNAELDRLLKRFARAGKTLRDRSQPVGDALQA